MSIKALASVVECSRAKGATYAVAIALGNHYNDEAGCAWPSYERLALYGRCSVRAAKAAVRELTTTREKGGLGEWKMVAGAGPRGTNAYRPIFKNLREPVIRRRGGAESAPPVQNPTDGGVQNSTERGAESAPKTLRTRRETFRVQNAPSGNAHQPDEEAATPEEVAELIAGLARMKRRAR